MTILVNISPQTRRLFPPTSLAHTVQVNNSKCILSAIPLFPAQFRLHSIQLDRQIRNDQFLVPDIVCPSFDLLQIQRYRCRLLHMENCDGLEFLMDRIPSLVLDLQTAIASGEV